MHMKIYFKKLSKLYLDETSPHFFLQKNYCGSKERRLQINGNWILTFWVNFFWVSIKSKEKNWKIDIWIQFSLNVDAF